MNEYVQTLKQKLEQVDTYVQHDELPQVGVLPVLSSKQKLFTVTNFFWFLGIVIISVSVVAFFTQAVLLVVDNTSDTYKETLVEKKEEPKTFFDEVYVRAGSNPFDIEEKPVQKDIEKPVDLGIPGVSRIGYIDSLGESVLSDNINKYSKNTLVIGGREGELGADGRSIGGGDDVVSQGKYSVVEKSVVPKLSSKGYLVADLETGEIIVEKNADTIYPLASVSKLMTALVAREKMDMQTVAIVSRDASRAYGAQGGLALGEKIRLRDLLFPLLMESSNDAAEVFADQYGHAEFIEEMNKKAKALDMIDTYYGDPSGLDPQNTSTPKDLLKLARYIHEYDPEIYDMTRVKQFSIKGHTWYNRNGLLSFAGFVGGKNGYIDQSRQTTVSLFEVPLARGGMRTVVVVVLKSDAKDSDVAKLLNYLKRSVRYEVE